MNRLRLAAPALILGLSLLSGCCHVGHGEILHRLGFGSARRPCETCGSAPVSYQGPDLCDSDCAAGAGGGPMLGPSGIPNLAPPPNRLSPEAPRIPADPASVSKIR